MNTESHEYKQIKYKIMSKKSLLYFFLFLSINSFGQTYYPFPDSVGVWKQTSSFYEGSDIHYALFMNGDTIINSITYNKLYYSDTPNNIDTDNSNYYGAIRENNKKIYFFPDSIYNIYYPEYFFCFTSYIYPYPSFTEEVLLYDFNVNVGDTVHYPHLDSTYIIITWIDSVLVQGEYRKQYNYSYSYKPMSSCQPIGPQNYVEGIGDINMGLFSIFIWYFENSESLNCFEDDEVFYSNVSNCMTVGNEDIKTKESYQIYPNPTSEVLFIELDNPITNLIYILDITGKEVYSTKTIQKTTSIDVSSFKIGLYIVKIVSNQGNITSKLISIN
ncbi:MAG: T9SS type A sorting domain-containing protein [Flavobacteriales bacterium]|nr:MAG: T9SS type A sorting domain-containing protein [Flavobacteriales bacterium]